MKCILKIIILWLVSINSAYAIGIDCAKPLKEVDKFICQDQEIIDYDKALSAAFNKVLASYSIRLRINLENGQKKWLMLRDEACMLSQSIDISGCLISVYEQRIQELKDLSDIHQLYKNRKDLLPPNIEKILDDKSINIQSISDNRPLYLEGSNFKIKREARTCREVFTLTKGRWSYGYDTPGLLATQSVLSECTIKILSAQNFQYKNSKN